MPIHAPHVPLTETQVRDAEPRAKRYRLYDRDGLYLEVAPGGGKWWRFKYRFARQEKRLSLGTWPDTSLDQARARTLETRETLAKGIDPLLQRNTVRDAEYERLANTFEAIARDWLGRMMPTWVPSHGDRIKERVEKDILPWIGKRPVTELTASEFLAVIRRIESRGALETAHRALSNCGQIMRYAIATARATDDPTKALRGALAPAKVKHLAAVTEPERVAELLRAFDAYQGSLVTRCALRFAPLVFVRPGELRHAKWEDINFETAEWRFIASKTHTPHIVPLSTQAISILREIEPFSGRFPYVFPSGRSRKRAMSSNAILAAMRLMGIAKDEMTGHGFRAMARTILDEVLQIRPDFIEHQLAHAVRDPNGRAYNRTAHLEERRKMMQVWADYLDELKQRPTKLAPQKAPAASRFLKAVR